jgi:iron-sulfur cluster repair protein YtfE (RIC family)
MRITEALLGEHGVFYAQFAHLEQTVPNATALVQVQAQGALLAAALRSHASMEDKLLFVALEPHLGTQMGPLVVMRSEHEQIEAALEALPAAAELEQAQWLLLGAIEVARARFAKEEQILFPAAKQVLGDEKLRELGRQWSQHRGVTVM